MHFGTSIQYSYKKFLTKNLLRCDNRDCMGSARISLLMCLMKARVDSLFDVCWQIRQPMPNKISSSSPRALLGANQAAISTMGWSLSLKKGDGADLDAAVRRLPELAAHAPLGDKRQTRTKATLLRMAADDRMRYYHPRWYIQYLD